MQRSVPSLGKAKSAGLYLYPRNVPPRGSRHQTGDSLAVKLMTAHDERQKRGAQSGQHERYALRASYRAYVQGWGSPVEQPLTSRPFAL